MRVSCRTGLQRGGRPLRGGCTGLGEAMDIGPRVARLWARLFCRDVVAGLGPVGY